MAAFIFIVIVMIIVITYAMVRISISCIFWSVNNPKDKQAVFRLYFPYYIILLTMVCSGLIWSMDFDTLAWEYFSSVYILALLIWRYELKSYQKQINSTPKKTNLP